MSQRPNRQQRTKARLVRHIARLEPACAALLTAERRCLYDAAASGTSVLAISLAELPAFDNNFGAGSEIAKFVHDDNLLRRGGFLQPFA